MSPYPSIIDGDEINDISTTDSVLTDKVCDKATTAATISSNSSTVSELFDSDDSVADKDYVPHQSKNNKISVINSDSDSDFIENSQQNNIRVSESPEREEFEPENQSDQASENVIQLTKKESVRKRKHYDTSLRERSKAKRELKTIAKYCVKPGCGEECKKSVLHIYLKTRERL